MWLRLQTGALLNLGAVDLIDIDSVGHQWELRAFLSLDPDGSPVKVIYASRNRERVEVVLTRITQWIAADNHGVCDVADVEFDDD